MSDEKSRNIERWHAAAHGMQTGVAWEHGRGSDDGTPKHLRVGINTALSDHAGLVRLLIKKGLITEEEYLEAIADAMEEERDRYEKRIMAEHGVSIKLR